MGLISKLKHSLTQHGTLRFDANGVHRSWRYDSTDEHEREAVQRLAEYASAHGVPQRHLDVWTQNECINYRIRTFMFSTIHDRFKHYLVFPDWVHSPNTDDIFWSINFDTAVQLDDDYRTTTHSHNSNNSPTHTDTSYTAAQSSPDDQPHHIQN